jgi:lipopolysaccharide/colanic/teichoic acid biosynthesis glycosyltransferase
MDRWIAVADAGPPSSPDARALPLGNGSLGAKPETRTQLAAVEAPEEAVVLHLPNSGDAVLELDPAQRVLEGQHGLLEARPWQLAVKRTIDVTVSILGLALLLPLLVLTVFALAVSSRGPILFRQQRVGRGGKTFTLYKFRSMYRDAHYVKPQLIDMNEVDGPVFKIREDPRITPVGRVLRRFSIDELPQLLNVIKGDMSLVGPRPPLPEECQHYGELERQRLAVSPGITGIWQVSGRSLIDFDTWIRMDLEYIRTWSLRGDLRILLRTIPAVLSGKGAY